MAVVYILLICGETVWLDLGGISRYIEEQQVSEVEFWVLCGTLW